MIIFCRSVAKFLLYWKFCLSDKEYASFSSFEYDLGVVFLTFFFPAFVSFQPIFLASLDSLSFFAISYPSVILSIPLSPRNISGRHNRREV